LVNLESRQIGGFAGVDDGREVAAGAFEASTVPQLVVDRSGEIVQVNAAFELLAGRGQAELVGAKASAFMGRSESDLARRVLDDVANGASGSASFSCRYRRCDGSSVAVECDVALMRRPGEPPLFVVAARDLTSDEEVAAELSYQAFHDPLTGLANRALFEDRLGVALGRQKRGVRCALLLLDLDDFKGVNDTLGHSVGDELLVAFAERLRGATRSSDTLCRFGGDEFLVLVEDIDADVELEQMADRILHALSSPFRVGDTVVMQKASIGVVPLDATAGAARSVLELADTAMYEAKRTGKGRRVVFDPEFYERAVERFELAQDLGPGLERGELSMHYQPLVDLRSGAVVGFEALMRWSHPSRGAVSPELFIAIAEQSGLIFDLGAFALSEATRAVMCWTALGSGPAPYIAVNLSTRQLRDENLLWSIEQALTASGLPPERLVLEVTETAAVGDLDAAAATIKRLATLGVAVAIDDFGTGYSSLSYLPSLAPQIIKIDRSFVDGAGSSPERISVLEGVISLGHRLSATIVAEGIETEGERACLAELGCEVGQGFLFSPAVPASEVPALLARLGAGRQ
jgi:diguanylate cyclase (GGDEF)-like protein/PAS domain S-box-containing protein